MSGSESEHELADFLAEEVFSGKPRSVGEALQAADEVTEPAPELPEQPDAPIEVEDEPQRDTEEGQPEPELPAEPEPEPEEEDIEGDTDPNIIWATKKYGDDPAKWAKAAFDMEQMISRLGKEKKEAESLASEWYQYAQDAEANAAQQMTAGMPMSAAEEQWVEQSVLNPLQAARQAAIGGNVNLFNAVLTRVAEDNPTMAGQIGAQVTMEMQQLAAQQDGAPEPSLEESLSGSIQRLGIDLPLYGDAMSAKIAELGEYHPYVQTILSGDQSSRDIALMAIYDLVRTGALTTRKVRSEERDEQLRHEADLRRQAAGVVTGGPTPPPAPKEDPFLSAMEDEWRARGQWDG